jgi:pyrophosphatase PpaX
VKTYSAYLFDLDGTLLDTIDLIVECFKHTLSEFLKTQVARRQIVANIGLPLIDQYKAFLEPQGMVVDYHAVMDQHMHYQLKHWQTHIKPFDGAQDTLTRLKQQGAAIAIVTSRRRETAELYSESFGFMQHVDILCTPENTTKHKPHPEPALWTLNQLGQTAKKSLFVGDSSFDIQCGQAAGTDTCYVNWGHQRLNDTALQPTFNIDQLRELTRLKP